MIAAIEPPAGLEAVKVEAPESAESTLPDGAEPLTKVSLEELAADPGRFEGQVVVPNEMLRVETSVLHPGANPLPLIVACKHLNLDAARADVRFPIVASPALAEKLREAIRGKKLDDDTSMAILDIRVRKDPGRPGEYVGVVERCEFLLTWSGAKIFQEKYGRAFLCLVVTGDAMEVTDHGGDRWRARLGTLIPSIRNEYRRMANSQRDQLFSQMERQLQRDTNSVNKVLQQQQAEMLRRAFLLR